MSQASLILHLTHSLLFLFFFFFNDTATTEIYTLSLHDALPIYAGPLGGFEILGHRQKSCDRPGAIGVLQPRDRKSTRLNSSHVRISYAVFCLKKKKKNKKNTQTQT